MMSLTCYYSIDHSGIVVNGKRASYIIMLNRRRRDTIVINIGTSEIDLRPEEHVTWYS